MSHGSNKKSNNTLQSQVNVGTANSPSDPTRQFQQSRPDQAGTVLTTTGVIAFAAVHHRLRWRGEDTTFFGIGFDDGTMFLSRLQPPVYDARAKKIVAGEIPPGSVVNVRYRVEGRVNWLDAIQIVQLAEEESPFMPVMDRTHP
jgi:hypothetical protein